MRRVIKNEAGSTGLIALLVICAVVVVGGAWYAMQSNDPKEKAAPDPHLIFEELKGRITKVMENPALISMNVERNPNPFACLYSSAGKCQGYGGLFVLYEELKPQSPALSQMMRGAGLSADGTGCNSFPSVECPIRIEALWSPVCGGNYCENTRSVNLKATLVLQSSAEKPPVSWEHGNMFTPTLKLSKGVTCERGGGIWSGTTCMSPSEALAARGALSPRDGPAPASIPPNMPPPSNRPVAPEDLVCPDSIPIQGQVYTLERIMPGQTSGDSSDRAPVYTGPNVRGRVSIPSMSGCPGEDTFIFQCQAKMPAQFEGEGQWIQVEAQMAPACAPDERQSNSTAGSDGNGGYARQ